MKKNLLGLFEAVNNDTGLVSGWSKWADSSHQVELEIVVNGSTVIEVSADRFRKDLLNAGHGSGCCAFWVKLPLIFHDGKSHEIEVVEKTTGNSLRGGEKVFKSTKSMPRLAISDNFNKKTLFSGEFVKLNFDHLSGDSDFLSAFHLGVKNGSYTTCDGNLYLVRDCYVSMVDGVLFDKDKIHKESLFNVDRNRFFRIKTVADEQMILPYDTASSLNISGPSFILAGGFPSNYFHWHVDILTRLFAVDFLPEKTKIIVPELTQSFQKEMFGYIKKYYPELEWEFYSGNSLLKFEELYYAPHLGGKYPRLSRNLIDFYNDFKRCVLLESDHIPSFGENIFLSRAGRRRGLENESQILEKLMEYWDFEVVDPENLTYLEQVHLFSNCKVVVGAHGAAFTNLLYADDSASVVEIFPENYLNVGLQRLAMLKGLGCYYLIGSHSMENTGGFVVDPDLVVGAVQKAIA